MRTDKFILNPKNSILLVIDIQEKFLPHIKDNAELKKKTSILIQAAKRLGIPMLITEQYPKGLGETALLLQEKSGYQKPVVKDTFSCCGEQRFLSVLNDYKRTHIVVTGIEAHVCVFQTVIDLLDKKYSVHVVSDCVGSRHKKNKQMAISTMRQAGAIISPMETVIFQWLKRSGTPEFKEIQPLIK